MKKIFVFFLMLLFIPVIGFCSTIKVLNQDTDLHPQGWPYGTLKFKGGTQVILNETGEVITGVMSYNEPLLTPGMISDSRISPMQDYELNRINFKGSPDSITFNEKGQVISGTPAGIYAMRLIRDAGAYMKLKNVIAFNSDGSVRQGTIAHDYAIRPLGWLNFLPLDDNAGFIKFKADTEVIFGPNAQVIKGTIANELKIKGITYPAGTTLEFSESGLPQKN